MALETRTTEKTRRQQQLLKFLSRKSGASITQIQDAFSWQPHSVRAAID